jgi:hypothetical protein
MSKQSGHKDHTRNQLKASRKATKYCLKFIEAVMGSKVTVDDYKHVLAKVNEIEKSSKTEVENG